MRKVLIDSGPLIALFDKDDKYHAACVDFIKHNTAELLTSTASLTETLHLLDFSLDAQIDFLSWVIAGGVSLEQIDIKDLVRIKELSIKYSDLPMDFADACLVYLGEKFHIDEVASIDSDFDVYRLNKNKCFKNVISR